MLKRSINMQAENKKNVVSSLPLKKDAEMVLEKYAIIQTGGKQYFALENKTIMIEKIEGSNGDAVVFNEVLFKRVDGVCKLGTPFLNEPINAIIVKHLRGDKIIVFKFKRRKKYRKKQGHRQSYTVVRIGSID
jgi:large subunit ribosomal protein L21